MADAPSNATYLLRTATPDLPSARVLSADNSAGLAVTDTGPGGTLSLETLGNLKKLYSYSSTGLVAYNSASQTFSSRSIAGSSSVEVANGDGVLSNPTLSVIPSTTVQMINVQLDGSSRATRPEVNFIQGDHISIGVTDIGIDNKVNVRFDVTGLAGGTVTSVGAESPLGTIDISGSPITAAGVFDFDLPLQPDVTEGVYYNATVTVNDFGIVTNISDGEGPGSDTVTDVDWTMSPYEVNSDDQLINVTDVNPSQVMEIILPFATRGRGIIIKDTSNALSNFSPIRVTVEGEVVPSFLLEGPLTLEDEATLTADGFEFILEDGDVFEMVAEDTLSGGTQIIGGTIDGQTVFDMEVGYASLSLRGLSSTSNEWAII